MSGLLLMLPVSARAQAPTNADCQVCHADPSMTRADGRPVVVAEDPFAKSVHGSFGCVDCHSDLEALAEFPHAERLAPVNCASCHDEPATRFATSVHAQIPAGAAGPATCADCHGPPHEMMPSADPASGTHKLRIAMTCGRCHSDTAPPGALPAPPVAALFADSIHGQALSESGLVVAPTCTDCHRSHDVVAKESPESPVHRTRISATCGTCHAGILSQFHESVHGAALAAGNGAAPDCASCHTAHSIGRTEADDWQLGAVEQCGTCHREALATYRDTFHGQVTALGFTPVAKCIDCHNSHQIFGPSDARSRVAPVNLVTTCQSCHPSANLNFVRYQPHANKHDRERSPALYYASQFMNVLLAVTFTFFGLHSAMWFARERIGTGEKSDRRE